jgi:aminoglycoside phosphotransferase (APT) family kinase protein
MNTSLTKTRTPTEADVRKILRAALGKIAASVQRFPTGLTHWVYDVVTAEGERLVVRLARPVAPDSPKGFAGAQHWYQPLTRQGVPLPHLHYLEVDAMRHGFPVMILERLPGTDLGAVYAELEADQKRQLATRIAHIQRSVGELPHGSGYGYAQSPTDPTLLPTWYATIEASLALSHTRIEKVGLFSPHLVELTAALFAAHRPYFDTVPPLCYLDDTTTKNVIIHQGELSGIVDIDCVAFGDPLMPIALTHMSLKAAGHETSYINHWLDAYAATDQQRHIMHLYTALYCLGFMAELGTTFNRPTPEPVDATHSERLHTIFHELTA